MLVHALGFSPGIQEHHVADRTLGVKIVPLGADVHVGHAENVEVNGCHFHNFNNWHNIEFNGCYNFRSIDNKFEKSGTNVVTAEVNLVNAIMNAYAATIT